VQSGVQAIHVRHNVARGVADRMAGSVVQEGVLHVHHYERGACRIQLDERVLRPAPRHDTVDHALR
jgi:hypothetical protein